MPSISRAKKRAATRAADDRASVRAMSKNKKAKPKRIKNYTSNRKNAGRNSNALIPIRTLLPKEITVGIQYRQVIQFATQGYNTLPGGLFSPTLLKINLLDPAVKVGPDSNGIITVLNYGGTSAAPVYSLLNSDVNLANKLHEYRDRYEKCCVIGSSAQVRVQGNANQTLGKYLANVPSQGSNTEGSSWGSNYPPHLTVQDSNKDGELYIWSVRQRGTGQLIDNNQGLNIHEVRTKLPGAKMRKHNCYQNGTTSKAVLMTARYSPKFLGIKDWRDNLNKIAIETDGITDRNPDAKDCFMYVGLANKFGNTQGHQPATVTMEISCDFKVRFLQRSNDPDGGDEPLAAPVHTEL